MKPYYEKNANNEDLVFFEFEGKKYSEKIAPSGIERYIFENESIYNLVYLYTQKIERKRRYIEVEHIYNKEKLRDRYFCKKEKSRAKRLDEPIYDDMN